MRSIPFHKVQIKKLLLYPDWYLRLEKELRSYVWFINDSTDEEQRKAITEWRHKFYQLVADMLGEGKTPLAKDGPDFDEERKPVDTAVIHHTKEEPDISLVKLSAIGLIRQYALEYAEDKNLRGKPIWSGHFRDGEMVFFAYHWLVRPDGTAERLLKDEYIGWHAGHWDVNIRSVGIALSGDYQESTPPFAQIKGAARIIRKHYPRVKVYGHREAREHRTCPGENFLGGWKNDILKNLRI